MTVVTCFSNKIYKNNNVHSVEIRSIVCQDMIVYMRMRERDKRIKHLSLVTVAYKDIQIAIILVISLIMLMQSERQLRNSIHSKKNLIS